MSQKPKKTIMWQETALYSYHYVKDLAGQQDGQFDDGKTYPIWNSKEQTLTS